MIPPSTSSGPSLSSTRRWRLQASEAPEVLLVQAELYELILAGSPGGGERDAVKAAVVARELERASPNHALSLLTAARLHLAACDRGAARAWKRNT